MNVKQVEGNIVVSVNECNYTIIDKGGQIQLKDMFKFLDDNCTNVSLQDEQILFDDKIPKELQNGLTIYLRELISKTIVSGTEE